MFSTVYTSFISVCLCLCLCLSTLPLPTHTHTQTMAERRLLALEKRRFKRKRRRRPYAKKIIKLGESCTRHHGQSNKKRQPKESWVIEKAGEMCALDDDVNFKRILEEN